MQSAKRNRQRKYKYGFRAALAGAQTDGGRTHRSPGTRPRVGCRRAPALGRAFMTSSVAISYRS